MLAEKLIKYRGAKTIIYALPRGGVILGHEIARRLDAPLDLIITRKIGHPSNPEYAVCAVTEEGEPFCEEGAIADLDRVWFEKEIAKERAEAKRRRVTYLGGRKHLSPKNKIAIVVDDGVATGLTIRAALRLLHLEKPKKLIVAVPVGPRDMLDVLRAEADKVIILLDEEDYLGAVGSYYENFSQVSDKEVIDLLKPKQ